MTAVHEITTDEHGHRHGSDGTITMTLRDTGGRMFRRRAVKWQGAVTDEVCWLVAELGDVRVYQSGLNIIVTREDLNP